MPLMAPGAHPVAFTRTHQPLRCHHEGFHCGPVHCHACVLSSPAHQPLRCHVRPLVSQQHFPSELLSTLTLTLTLTLPLGAPLNVPCVHHQQERVVLTLRTTQHRGYGVRKQGKVGLKRLLSPLALTSVSFAPSPADLEPRPGRSITFS